MDLVPFTYLFKECTFLFFLWPTYVYTLIQCVLWTFEMWRRASILAWAYKMIKEDSRHYWYEIMNKWNVQLNGPKVNWLMVESHSFCSWYVDVIHDREQLLRTKIMLGCVKQRKIFHRGCVQVVWWIWNYLRTEYIKQWEFTCILVVFQL